MHSALTSPAARHMARRLSLRLGLRTRLALAVWAGAAAALALAAAAFRAPGFMDAYYYYHVAANLAAGRGFTEDIVWNYLTNAPAVTHPSNLYWMPLTSLLMAPAFALFGEGFRAAQAVFVALSAVVVAATALVGYARWRSAFKAAAAAAIALFSGYYFVYWTALDSFGVFALAAGSVFLATGALRQAQGRTRWLAAGTLGVAVALAHLARADGPLLGLAAAATLASWRAGRWRQLLPELAVSGAAYLALMAPWFVRNLTVAGAPLGMGGAATVFLTEYNEIFSYLLPLTWERYWQQELGAILAGKAAAAARNLGVLFGLEYWLIPFAVLGWWRLRGWAPMVPALVYAVLLYLVMTLVFTFPSGRGSMLHSGVALVPWLAIAAVEGIEAAVALAAQRLHHWNAPVATRNFTLIFVAISAALCVYLTYDQTRQWHDQVDGYAAMAPAVAAPDPVVMTLNPPGWWYITRQRSIQTPSDGPEAAAAAARRYGATHLLLEPARSRPWQDANPQDLAQLGFHLVAQQDGYQLFQLR